MERKVDLAWDDDGVMPPKVYPDTLFLFEKMEERTIEVLAIAPGEKALDLGCGKAGDAVKLAKRGGDVIGLDPSGIMMRKARSLIEENSAKVALVQGIGEELPFRAHSLDKVMCKGALDHFIDPAKTMEEIARVLRPGGEAVFAIANFESLSCKVGRFLYPITRLLPQTMERPTWEIPPDHTYRFDYHVLRGFVDVPFRVEGSIGVSLLWGTPFWGRFLKLMPFGLSKTVLNLLDRLAHHLPTLSDVVILRCTPRST